MSDPRNRGGNVPVAVAAPKDAPSFGELWRVAVDHLITSKASKPAKTATLHSTLHAKLGKELPASTIDVVCSELVKRGYVKVSRSKVTYALPEVE